MSEYKKLSIKDWAEEDRPREKLMIAGINSLSNAELIAILIGSGNTEESAVELSKRILGEVNNHLHELAKLSINELIKRYKGIGEAKAISIVAALELGKRRKIEDVLTKQEISSSKDAADLFQSLLRDLSHEEFWILLLNRANKIIDKQKISIGGVSSSIIDIKIIMKNAIEKLASSIILCHNHPSGNIKPSESDIQITSKLKNGGKILDISVIDHIIVTDSGYFSFADEGIL